MVWVFAGRVEDGYADNAVGVDYREELALANSYAKGGFIGEHTIRMPDIASKLHGRWHERIVLWELELCWEDTAFVWCAFRSLYYSFPQEEIVFVDRPCHDAIRRRNCELLVLVEESFRCYRVHGVDLFGDFDAIWSRHLVSMDVC